MRYAALTHPSSVKAYAPETHPINYSRRHIFTTHLDKDIVEAKTIGVGFERNLSSLNKLKKCSD